MPFGPSTPNSSLPKSRVLFDEFTEMCSQDKGQLITTSIIIETLKDSLLILI
jgi:hypothetical protein